jgi:hypothetical protein
MNKKFRGIWISRKCLSYLHEGFNTNEVIVLSMVYSLSRKYGVCTASNGYIAERINLSDQRVSKIITRLKREGLIVEVAGLNRRGLDTTLPNQHSPTGPVIPEQHSPKRPVPTYSKVIDTKESSPVLPKKAPSKYRDIAKKLQAAIKEGKKIGRRCSPSWVLEIQRLAKELDGDTKRIETAVAWYAKNARGQGVPSIIDGKTLRKHFVWLEDAMRRGESAPKKVTPSDDALKIVSHLQRYIWPNGCDNQLPEAVEVSLRRYEKFRKAVYNLSVQLDAEYDKQWAGKKIKKGKTSFHNTVKHIASIMPDRREFVRCWFEAVWKSIYKWDDFSGNLKTFVFSVRNRRFMGMGQHWTASYTASVGIWEQLLERIESESGKA